MSLVSVRTLRFLYSGLKWPAAFAEVEIFVPGRATNSSSPYDLEHRVWKGRTDAQGRVPLGEVASMLDGLVTMAEKKDPKLIGVSRRNIIGDVYIPDYLVKLLRLRITDRAAADGAHVEEFHPIRESFTLPWVRQPVGGFDGLEFSDVTDYLDYLQTRFHYLRGFRLDRLELRFVRAGTPAPRSYSLLLPFGDLRDMLQTAERNPADSHDRQQLARLRKKTAGIAQRVATAVAGELPAARRQTKLLDAYEAGLKELTAMARSLGPPVSWPPALPFGANGKLHALAGGIARAFEWPNVRAGQESPAELLVGIGIIVFMAGAIAIGYQWGSFDYSGDPDGNDIMTITISNSSACSEDDFKPYCHLIRP